MGLRGPGAGKLEACIQYLSAPGRTGADARKAGFSSYLVTRAVRKVEEMQTSGEIPPQEVRLPQSPSTQSKSLEEIERIADHLAFNGATEHIQLKAVDTAARVKMLTGNRGDIGPGIPLTPHERAIRFELMRRVMEQDDPQPAA